MTRNDTAGAAPAKGQSARRRRLALVGLIDRLDDLAEGKESVTLGEVVDEIGAQGHAPLLMVIALLMILPLGMIPGVGGALGLIVALIGAHMLIGRDRLALPRFVTRRSVSADYLSRLLTRIRPAAWQISKRMKVRYVTLSSGWLSMTLIAAALILGGLSMLILGAIPVAAPLLGLPIAVFSLGILTGDGMAIAGGWVLLGCAAAGIVAAGQAIAG